MQDAEIERAVTAVLLADERLRQTGIKVAVSAGVVRLRGRVRSASDRALARQLAERVPGVQAVVCELTVRAKRGRSDRALGVDVRTAMASDPLLSGSIVDVAVREGVVHLGGQLTSYLAKWHAEEAARNVPGVVDVVSDIVVVPLSPPTDSEVASAVLVVLARHPRVELPRISVDVVEGVVHLRGTVSSRARRWLVEELARSAAGVRDVVNELAVAR